MSCTRCTLLPNEHDTDIDISITVDIMIKNIQIIKGKAVPLQAWSGPEGSRKLR
jgi:hypothetical protein